MKHYASCSGGKDSVAMIEMMIAYKMPLDEIVFAVVDKEFKTETMFRKVLIKRWSEMGFKCVELQTKETWDKWFFGKMNRGKNKGKRRGYPLTAYPCWWSREAKFNILDRYMKDGIRYIGIAKDEPKRYHPEKYDQGYRYPLVTDFNMTEKDCYNLCESFGILNPLYLFFDRLGCYLCPKQSKKSLETLCVEFPNEWQELKKYVRSTNNEEFVSPNSFNHKLGIEELEELEKRVRDN